MSLNLLAVLAEVSVSPSWQIVESVLHKHLALSHALVYVGSQDVTASAPLQILILCSCVVDNLSLFEASSGISQDLATLFSATPEFRLYSPFYVEPRGLATLSKDQTDGLASKHILVSVSMTPTPTTDDTFNYWYLHEHIPLLQRVPTWISSERFKLAFSTKEVPLYLALHRWDSTRAFGTEEYKAAVNTEWRTAVMSGVMMKERFVLTYKGKLGSMDTNL